jgi:4-amino-4-deoxy-L-arabinose transferase-like glycosyltransferase
MKLFLKFKKELLLAAILAAAFLFLRLIFLDRLPIFTDEAIYIRWAQIALQDSSWRFISLTDGKQPMFVWVAIIFLKFFKDPLIAGRLVSVFSGFITMVGLWFLSYELFKNKTVAFLTSTLYIFYPFAQVLDRMALYDSMVATFFVWALYFSIHLVRKLKLDIAYSLGFIIGAGILTKSSNFFSIYLLPFTLILFDFRSKDLPKRLINWAMLAIFSSAIAYGLYNILRLSPLFEMISAKNAIFVYPFSQWLMHPFTFFVGNLYGLSSWLLEYLNFPYLILIIVSFIIFSKNFKEKALLFLYFLLPFVALALFGRIIFPRFIFFMSVMLLPLGAFGLNYIIDFCKDKIKLNISKSFYAIFITTLFVVYPGFVSLQFAYDPIHAPIATADNSQYVNSWAAGWGVSESVVFFKEESKNQKIYIATEGTFGLMPETMEMYLIKDKNITIKGYWPVESFPKEILDMSSKMPTYFIFYQPQHVITPADYPLKLVFKVRQGDTDFYYRVYQVIPPKNNK